MEIWKRHSGLAIVIWIRAQIVVAWLLHNAEQDAITIVLSMPVHYAPQLTALAGCRIPAVGGNVAFERRRTMR